MFTNFYNYKINLINNKNAHDFYLSYVANFGRNFPTFTISLRSSFIYAIVI